jgi:hypothetical protein
MDVARRSGNPLTDSDRNVADPLTFGVDVSWTSPLQIVAKGANKTVSLAGALVKPSDGLEPSTPPYHYTRGHSRARLSCKSATQNVSAVPARDRMWSV